MAAFDGNMSLAQWLRANIETVPHLNQKESERESEIFVRVCEQADEPNLPHT